VAAGLVSAWPAGEPITKDLGGAPIMEVNLRAQEISVAIRTLEDRIAGMKKGMRDRRLHWNQALCHKWANLFKKSTEGPQIYHRYTQVGIEASKIALFGLKGESESGAREFFNRLGRFWYRVNRVC